MFSQQQSHENEHSQARNVRPYGVAGSSNTLSPTSSLSALPSWVTLAIFRQLQTIHLLSKKQKPEKQDGLHASGVNLTLLPLHKNDPIVYIAPEDCCMLPDMLTGKIQTKHGPLAK